MRRRTFIKDYIKFEDSEMEKLCANEWGDGFGITYMEAELVNEIPYGFCEGNNKILSFKEFTYFKNCKIIGANSFRDCTNLKSIEFPKSITKIYDCAFMNDKNLIINSINFPNLTGIIGNYVFDSVKIHEIIDLGTITKIGNYNFYNCNLSKIIIPNTLKYIGEKVFSNITLKDIPKTKDNKTTIFDIINEIKWHAFTDTELTIENLNIPNLIECGGYFNKFNMKNIENLGKLTHLREIIQNNQYIENITLPNTLIYISYRAFIQTPNLKSITINVNGEPPQFGDIDETSNISNFSFWENQQQKNDWMNKKTNGFKIYVPIGMKAKYNKINYMQDDNKEFLMECMVEK